VIYVRVPRDVRDEMQRICAERGVSMAVFVSRALICYLAKFGFEHVEPPAVLP
jgi:hypothetical protein